MSRVASDEAYMAQAIAVAKRNPMAPFGALLVDSIRGEVVAEGWNTSKSNPIRHGEMDAILRYAEDTQNPSWSSLWLYTTAEPCCMCQGAVVWAGIPRVVYGTSIATLTSIGWRQIQISATEVVRRSWQPNYQIVGGVLEGQCDTLFRKALGKDARKSD